MALSICRHAALTFASKHRSKEIIAHVLLLDVVVCLLAYPMTCSRSDTMKNTRYADHIQTYGPAGTSTRSTAWSRCVRVLGSEMIDAYYKRPSFEHA